MPSDHASTASASAATTRDIRGVEFSQLKDTIRVTIDRELIDELDRQCAGTSRSAYLEMVLRTNLLREEPHVADDWTPEHGAQRGIARLARYLHTGQ